MKITGGVSSSGGFIQSMSEAFGFSQGFIERLRRMDEQGNMFREFTKQIKEAEEKKRRAENRRQRRGGVMVNGATSKNDIRRLKRILRQRISEVAAEGGENKLKQLQITDLNRKILALDRILAQIEKMEREQVEAKSRQSRQNNRTEAVYLTSSDLSVGKNGVVAQGLGSSAPVSTSIDILAGFSASANIPTDVQVVDLQL